MSHNLRNPQTSDISMFGFTDVVNVPKKRTVDVWQVHRMCILVYGISRTMNPHYLYRAY